jgi:hypothetical protein
MGKTKVTQQKMKSLQSAAGIIATCKMQDKDKYPQFFEKKIYSDLDFKVRPWEDEGILLTPVLNLFGELSLAHQKGYGYIDVRCTSLYIGFLFYGITIRLGIKYVPVKNFKEEIEYHDDYWKAYDSYIDSYKPDHIQKPVKKEPKKREIKKDSTKFVNKKSTKSTKPKKNAKV